MTPLFEFFEIIAEELTTAQTRVITRVALQAAKDVSPLLDDLQEEFAIQPRQQEGDLRDVACGYAVVL